MNPKITIPSPHLYLFQTLGTHLVRSIMYHLELRMPCPANSMASKKHQSCKTQLFEFIKEVSAATEHVPQQRSWFWTLPRHSTESVIACSATNSTTMAYEETPTTFIHKFPQWSHPIYSGWRCLISSMLVRRPVSTSAPSWDPASLYLMLHINNLPSKISFPSRPSADDIALYRFITSTDDSAKLQEDLQCQGQWEREWDMAFHPYKYKYSMLPFTKSHSSSLSNYILHT